MTQEPSEERGVLEWITPHVNPHSGIPIYIQIVQAFARAIQRGTLRPGESLPTVRLLAQTLRLAPNTVTRAYAELQRQGLIESRAGAGTTVLSRPVTQFTDEASRQALTDELHDVLHRMLASGLTVTDLRRLLDNFTASSTQDVL